MIQRAAPDVIAVEDASGALTYGELRARARRGAASLAGASRVAIALPAGLDFVVALHAALLAGAAVVPVDLREPEWRLAQADVVIDAPLKSGQGGGGGACCAARRARHAGPRRAYLGDHRRSATHRADGRADPCQRARVRRRPGALSVRAVAVSFASEPCGRADGAAAVRDLRDDRRARARRSF